MSSSELQFIFSLFSFVGVVGILFYIILQREKEQILNEKIEIFEEKIASLKESLQELKSRKQESGGRATSEGTLKEQIIALHEEGKEISFIEDRLDVPKAKIEMILNFHNLRKSDNWKNSVDENL